MLFSFLLVLAGACLIESPVGLALLVAAGVCYAASNTR